jgi:hypothetical protein
MADPIRPELLARFGNDPDALEWARGVVQESIDLLEGAADLPQAGPEFRRLARWTVTWMRDQFTGSPGERGCVGRFDARLAEVAPAGHVDGQLDLTEMEDVDA